jgi:preprotein translocase subunit YajC
MTHTIYMLSQNLGGQGFLFALLLAIGVYMLVLASYNRKEKKQYQQMLANLKKNDRVMTIGGIVGSVVSATPEEVVVKVDESNNVKVTFVRSAIKKVLTEEPKATDLG